LAGRKQTSLAAVERLLDTLADLCRDELGPNGPGAVRLPRIGTLSAGEPGRPARPANRDDFERQLLDRLPTYAVKAAARSERSEGTEAREPDLDRAAVHRLLDHLAELTAAELHAGRPLRLTRIGTLRRRGERPRFTPSRSLGTGAVTFVPRPGLTGG
jgi:hypothetical protein